MPASSNIGERDAQANNNFQGLPDLPAINELKKIPQWVAWKYEDRGGPKPTKPPMNPHLRDGYASCDNPATWGTYEQAESRAKEDSLAGVGFVLSEDDNLYGYDFDNCFTRKGRLKPWAFEILAYGETYAEVSPSGKGIRIIARGKIATAAKCDLACVEMYGHGRYLTITGQRLDGMPDAIAPAPKTKAASRQRVKLHSDTWAALKRASSKSAAPATPQRKSTVLELFPRSGDQFWRNVNTAATQNPSAWVPAVFGADAKPTNAGGYRVSSKALGRPLQEDIGFHPDGIVDFGIEKGRTPIDVVIDHGNAPDAATAATWLCERLGVAPEALGWRTSSPSVAPDLAPLDEAPPTPIDLWGKLNSPALPLGLLPSVIESFAVEQARMMGADPAGLAMAALAVCGAAIPDRVALQVKRHDPTWTENTRLWVALIGDPSTKKTPMLRQAVRPISRIDGEMVREYLAKKAIYDELPPEDRKHQDPPKKVRLRIEDITIEAAQEVLKDSHDGVLCLQDEMTGWFASMDKYAGRGAGKDRAFWLQAYTGGEFVADRISRGTCYLPNLSISLVGGIQPEPLRKIVDDTVDDGLIQRLIPVLLRPATVGLDEPQGETVAEYGQLVESLRGARRPMFGAYEPPKAVLVHFSDAARVVRERMERWHIDLASCVGLSRKLAAHVGKYDGVFARLCLIWHCIERAKGNLIDPIDEHTALRVEAFMRKFLLPHAVSFYTGALQQADDHERLSAVAGYILERKLDVITDRDIARGDSTMRGLTKTETSAVFEQLSALGWLLDQVPGPRPSSPPRWKVNPVCHDLFVERAKMEVDRRRAAREALQEVFRAL